MKKGAFTGADRRKEGCFMQAHGGSLFLDEVSEMSLGMQVKLLQVLQERELRRVGGEQMIPVDVRVIVATNKDLRALIEKGLFREDLFYRLNVVGLDLPPLRQRREDIPILAQHFLTLFADRNRKQIKGFSPGAMDGLIRYDWPGNVRELMNAIERAVVLSRSKYLDGDVFAVIPAAGQDTVQSNFPATQTTADLPLDQVEKAAILSTLASADNNKSEAARRLGITRKTLHKKLKEYGVMP